MPRDGKYSMVEQAILQLYQGEPIRIDRIVRALDCLAASDTRAALTDLIASGDLRVAIDGRICRGRSHGTRGSR